MGLGPKIKIGGRLSARSYFGDETRSPRIHIGTRGEVYPRLETEFFIKSRFDLGKPLSPTEGLRRRQKQSHPLLSSRRRRAAHMFPRYRERRFRSEATAMRLSRPEAS